MTESSVEEELEIVGWTPATVSPVLVAELLGQAVLLDLVSVVASAVHCELPETAIALLERPDEVTAQDLKAVFASPARKAHSQVLSCRVHRGASRYAPVVRRAAAIRAGCSLHASDLLPQGESLASAEDLPGGTVTPTDFSRFAATAAATSNALGTCRRCLPQRRLRFGDACVHRGKTGQAGWRHWRTDVDLPTRRLASR